MRNVRVFLVKIRSKIKILSEKLHPQRRENLYEDSMKNILLLTLVPVLIVTWGFEQAASSKTTTTTTEQASIEDCLAGSAGNYTVKQDGTPQSFKITTSAVNLKPHLGHDVKSRGKE